MDHTFRWPWLAGIATLAAFAGFGLSYWLTDRTPPPAAPPAEASAVAAPTEVKIPTAYLTSANIAVEAVSKGGVATDILAPATVAGAPGSVATVVARASGTLRRLDHRLGDAVKAGEVLALVDSFDATAMAAERSVARARADLARKAFARESNLYQQGVSARQDMETAQSALAVAEAESRRAEAVASAAHVSDDGRSIAVVSPIDGRITASQAALGNFVQPQTELFQVAGNGAVQIEVPVTASDSARITEGDTATVVPAVGAPVSAVVHAITPTVSGSTQAATVVLTPTAPTPALVIGEGVQARLHASGSASGLSVPEDAVQHVDGHDVVFVRTADGFRARPVLVGTRSGGMAQLLSGVQAGEQVATRNAFLVKAELNKGVGEDE
ncbi:MAG: efflux transporter periplasmic adaptor subunit [Rhodanobacter sp. 68-29]|nr:efflux RND transporter periplasmic adaptor subunit [Rhodanobacter sp.]OJY56271.1 MAG: efflux transporter periplasmic adaptor subunit [Rhodanobacter sp. 68-29]